MLLLGVLIASSLAKRLGRETRPVERLPMNKVKPGRSSWTVILPNGTPHTLPRPLFEHYADLKLIRVSLKTPRVAHVPRSLRAWPVGKTLEFALKNPTPTDPRAITAVDGIWRMLMSLSTCDEPELYNYRWLVYSNLLKQYGAANAGTAEDDRR